MDKYDVQGANKKLKSLAFQLADLYDVIAGILARLPIPMLMPPLAEDRTLAVYSLSRAWELTDWEPLAAVTAVRIRDMITAWHTARELCGIAFTYGAAPWRLRAIEDALDRIWEAVIEVNRHLDGKFGSAELTEREKRWVAAHAPKRRRRRRRR